MKRILITLFAIGMTAMSSMSMAAMSNSQIRKETRFLTDKMAYEMNMNTAQYNDVYEVNFDFIYNVRYLLDDVVRGYEWALDEYYTYLDIRNDDLRWVLSDMQYRALLRLDHFFRPIYVNGPSWNFRMYVNYPNFNLFFFGKPYHYRTYSGDHYRTHYDNMSYYRGRYNHNHYGNVYSVRDNRVYNNYRNSDFGKVKFRSNSSHRPNSISTKTRPVPPTFGTSRGNSRGSDTSRSGNNSRTIDNNSSRTTNGSGNDKNRAVDNNNNSRSTGRSYSFGTRNTENSSRTEPRKESTTPVRESRQTSTPSPSRSESRPSNSERSSSTEPRKESATPVRESRQTSTPSPSRSESRPSNSERSSSSVTRSSSSSERSNSSSGSKDNNGSSRSSERSGSSRR